MAIFGMYVKWDMFFLLLVQVRIWREVGWAGLSHIQDCRWLILHLLTYEAPDSKATCNHYLNLKLMDLTCICGFHAVWPPSSRFSSLCLDSSSVKLKKKQSPSQDSMRDFKNNSWHLLSTCWVNLLLMPTLRSRHNVTTFILQVEKPRWHGLAELMQQASGFESRQSGVWVYARFPSG